MKLCITHHHLEWPTPKELSLTLYRFHPSRDERSAAEDGAERRCRTAGWAIECQDASKDGHAVLRLSRSGSLLFTKHPYFALRSTDRGGSAIKTFLKAAVDTSY
ncbi:unnamed protein product [Nezara viridula]|uniref:Uncharacterized protein n=1 Tax=Nezara viridula TaxID=85310 RepID=A0A9P0H4R2_NEZVI|nr:unnamed protein product [Nezara viridula]